MGGGNEDAPAVPKDTNLISSLRDNEDDLKIFTLSEGHLMTLCVSPPASLKCVEHNIPCIKPRVEVEGNVAPLILATCKVHVEVHPVAGRERGKKKKKIK